MSGTIVQTIKGFRLNATRKRLDGAWLLEGQMKQQPPASFARDGAPHGHEAPESMTSMRLSPRRLNVEPAEVERCHGDQAVHQDEIDLSIPGRVRGRVEIGCGGIN